MPSSRHPLDVRSDTGPDLGGGSKLGAAPIFFPAAAQGERSAPPPPGPPRAIPRGSRCTPFRQPGAIQGAPYGRRKRAQRSPLAGGRMRPVPCDPLGRRLRRCGPCRGSRVHRRRPARGAAARQGGDPVQAAPSPRGRTPSRAGTEPRTSPRAGRGAWWRLPCRPLTGRARPAAAFARAKATRGGQSGAHARGGADAVR